MSVPDDVIEGAAVAAAAAYITLWPVEQSANAFALMQREHAIAMVRAALSALEAAGWVCVPVEPTEAMQVRGLSALCEVIEKTNARAAEHPWDELEPSFWLVRNGDEVKAIYAAMLTASRHKEKQDG